MASLSDLLARNKEYIKTRPTIPKFDDVKAAQASGKPVPQLALITCCDPRVIPEQFCQIQLGEVMVIRNAGGRTEDALRDILVVDNLFGVNEIMVVHHTDCGLTHAEDASIREMVKERVPNDPRVDSMKFGEIKNLEQSLKDDVAFLRASPFLSAETKAGVSGWLYDIETGLVNPVDA